MTQATVTVEHIDDRAARIAVSGEIDLVNAATLQDELLPLITNQVASVTLDLADLAYIDSAGLRLLFNLGARLETLQIAFALLVPVDSPVRRVIELSGIASIASVQPAV